jgi:hypothetical protein
MFRKSIIAIGTIVALTVAALPSTASAHKGGGKFFKHHFHHFRSVGVTFAGTGMGCYRYKWIDTRFGFRRVLVNVCDVY